MKKIFGKIESVKYIKNELRSSRKDEDLEVICSKIINEVEKNKDRAVSHFNKEFDNSIREFELTSEEIEIAFDKVSRSFLKSVKKSISRSEDFHVNSKPQSWINDSGSLG